MLQPFEIFQKDAIDMLIGVKKFYVVAQTYKRGISPFEAANSKTPLLLKGYSDLGLARGHLNVLRADPMAAIIDLRRPAHKAKLIEMVAPGSTYTIYWAVIRNKEEFKEKIDENYKDNIQRYIKLKTNWKIRRDDGIEPEVQLIYGELFIILKHKGEVRRLTFAELEKS